MLSVRNEQSKYKRVPPITLSVSVHPEREAVEGSSRRVEVQAQDKRNSSEQADDNLEYPQILPNTKIEIPK